MAGAPGASTAAAASAASVRAELSYLAPQATVLRRFTAPGASVNTGSYRPYPVQIRNGRPVSGQFTLNRSGFAVTGHRSAVADFTDPAQVNRIYPGEVAELVKSATGADRVATLSWVLRRSAAPGAHASQPQAATVHNDYSAAGGRERAAAAYAERFAGGPGYRRAVITSLWRVFSPPPQDWPLAVCDATSVGPGEGLPNRMYTVEAIPDDLYADMPPDAPGASGLEFHYSPAHQWWYFPGMNRDEVIIVKLSDTDHSVAWRTPHSAFHDQSVQAAQPRHSIEFRTVAYFDQ